MNKTELKAKLKILHDEYFEHYKNTKKKREYLYYLMRNDVLKDVYELLTDEELSIL